jgi:hypothetical protein
MKKLDATCHHIGMVLVELILGDLDGLSEIIVGQLPVVDGAIPCGE